MKHVILHYEPKKTPSHQELVQERKQNFKFDWDSKVVEIMEAGAGSEVKF